MTRLSKVINCPSGKNYNQWFHFTQSCQFSHTYFQINNAQPMQNVIIINTIIKKERQTFAKLVITFSSTIQKQENHVKNQ